MLISFILYTLPYLNYCNVAIQKLQGAVTEENIAICTMLIEEAEFFHLEPDLVLAFAYEESRLTAQLDPNPWGCAGPLQIKVKHWCPNKDNVWSKHRADGVLEQCDLITRGVFTLKYYITLPKLSFNQKICSFGFGPIKKCKKPKLPPKQKRYVDAVLKNYRKLRGY